jgi:hypothetical protein
VTNGDAGEKTMMPWWVLLVLDALTAFTNTAGGGLVVAMVHAGIVSWPTPGVIVVAAVLGLMAASNQLRARLALPPINSSPRPGV